jgi:hypothetical protein
MTAEIVQLDSPIDALYLIHKALRIEAERAEQAVEHLEIGGSFKPFQRVFYRWAMTLSAYFEAEETSLMALLPDVSLAWKKAASAAGQLMDRMEALQTYLQAEIGKTMVIARTKRHLFGRVALLRILQEDLLEDEEERLLPALRAQLSEARQLEMIRPLLIDQDAAQHAAMPKWIAQDVTAPERQALAALTVRL